MPRTAANKNMLKLQRRAKLDPDKFYTPPPEECEELTPVSYEVAVLSVTGPHRDYALKTATPQFAVHKGFRTLEEAQDFMQRWKDAKVSTSLIPVRMFDFVALTLNPAHLAQQAHQQVVCSQLLDEAKQRRADQLQRDQQRRQEAPAFVPPDGDEQSDHDPVGEESASGTESTHGACGPAVDTPLHHSSPSDRCNPSSQQEQQSPRTPCEPSSSHDSKIPPVRTDSNPGSSLTQCDPPHNSTQPTPEPSSSHDGQPEPSGSLTQPRTFVPQDMRAGNAELLTLPSMAKQKIVNEAKAAVAAAKDKSAHLFYTPPALMDPNQRWAVIQILKPSVSGVLDPVLPEEHTQRLVASFLPVEEQRVLQRHCAQPEPAICIRNFCATELEANRYSEAYMSYYSRTEPETYRPDCVVVEVDQRKDPLTYQRARVRQMHFPSQENKELEEFYRGKRENKIELEKRLQQQIRFEKYKLGHHDAKQLSAESKAPVSAAAAAPTAVPTPAPGHRFTAKDLKDRIFK